MSTVLVTGAASGIGRALVSAFAEAGFHVAAGVRDVASAEGLDAPGVTVVGLDVTDDAQVADAIAEVGPLDVVVNNAGIADSGPLETIEWEVARHVFEVNVWGALRVIRAVVGPMRERGHGTIVNISSVGGRTPSRGFHGVYMASKSALRSLSEALKWELDPFGVRVLLVEPGFVRTSIFDRAGFNAAVPASPYADEEAWVREFYLRGAEMYGAPPEGVAHRVVHLVEDPTAGLYNPLGDDATAGIEAARQAPDFEAWFEAALTRVETVAGPRPSATPAPEPDAGGNR
ncbi:MAG: SDR family oxidoreductase [Acidimicrobiia bacterium]|nr:SDR family oxidoreductase [Acidimicrobiia bacterium]